VKKLRVLVLVHEDFLAPESLGGLPASEADEPRAMPASMAL